MEIKWDQIEVKRNRAWERSSGFEKYGFINDSWWKAPKLRESSQG